MYLHSVKRVGVDIQLVVLHTTPLFTAFLTNEDLPTEEFLTDRVWLLISLL